jgi:alpha-beta hydrolase superfamily lysophospholipase
MFLDERAQHRLTFSGQRQLALAEISPDISEESQAALRQLSLERLMAYGVDHADAMELRARVQSGEIWQTAASDLAHSLTAPSLLVAAETRATRTSRLFRASALLRMSQMMMFLDNDERRGIFAQAAQLFEEATTLAGDRERMIIDCDGAPLIGWMYPAAVPVGQVIVIGGIEGWAMDFAAMGVEFAKRGLDTLLLDGPGQGESRLLFGHLLTAKWDEDYACVITALAQRSPLPIGFVGNSMGGAVAVHVAARDARIKACCDNGGSSRPGGPRPLNSFFRKMMAHAGAATPEEAYAIWGTVDPIASAHPLMCPLLVVQGGNDPLVTMEHAERILESAQSSDKRLELFSDGDHCIYNHSDDKHAVIGDWMASRLAVAG